MINSDVQENINIKIEQARELQEKAYQLCLNYVHTQDSKSLKHMGGYLGTFVNNLRSALNYATADYCQQRKFATRKNDKKLSTDFPYGFTKDKFGKIPLALFMSQSDPDLYSFIESLQPYNENQWLGDLMTLSNMDKHKILVTVRNVDISQFIFVDYKGRTPQHMGSHVLIPSSDDTVAIVQTPCYIEQLRMFALPNGKWLNFFIPIDNYFKEILPFMTHISGQIEDLIDEFYKKF